MRENMQISLTCNFKQLELKIYLLCNFCTVYHQLVKKVPWAFN